MIPDNEDINAALKAVAVKQTFAGMSLGGMSNSPDSLYASEPFGCFGGHIGFQAKTKLSFQSLLELVRRELDSKGHAFCKKSSTSGRQIAKLTLAAATILEPDDIRKGLTELVESVSASDAELFAISMDNVEDTGQFRIGDFLYGPLNFERLEHFDSMAKAAQLQPKLGGLDITLHNRKSLTLSRRLTGINTIYPAFACVGHESEGMADLMLGQWLNQYHEIVATELWRDFKGDFVGQQAVAASCGVPSIPIRPFFGDSYSASLVTAFSKTPEDFAFLISKHHVSSDDDEVVPSELETAWNEVVEHLGLNDWGTFGLDRELGRYCEYIQKAESYRNTGNVDEALVHYVFGLDFLLGGEKGESLTVVVSERAASVASGPLNQDFSRIIKQVGSAYDKRSGYAHRGEQVDFQLGQESVDALADVARVVLAAACYARKQTWCDGKKSWLNRIDVIRAKRRVTNAVVDEESRELGLGLIYKPEKAKCFAIRWNRGVGEAE